jgi:hypothetical protein
MCHHPDRDARGRLLPGHTANPAGRPVRKPYLRLLEAAEACGARIIVELPAPRPTPADPGTVEERPA